MEKFENEFEENGESEEISTEDVTEEELPYKREPKQNYVIYTILSIILFFVVYFSVEFISGKINAEYYMEIDGKSLTEEQKSIISEYASIDSTDIKGIRLERVNKISTVTVFFYNIDDIENFAEGHILYEYGDVVDDLRIEIYPYENEISEYAYACSYVNIDDPSIYCYVYEFEGEGYADYYSNEMTSEISTIFMDAEKIYF